MGFYKKSIPYFLLFGILITLLITNEFAMKKKLEKFNDIRILIAHNKYLIRGGEDVSTEADIALFRENIIFIEELIEDNKKIESIGELSAAIKSIWSFDTITRVKNIITEKNISLLIVQNFFPLLSPSIYYAAKSKNIPVLQILHNYRLICLNGLLFRDDHICEDCVNKFFPYPGVYHKCYKQSLLGSFVVAFMLFIHRIIRTWNNKIDNYIALTNFSKKKFLEAGFSSEKIKVKPHFIFPDPGEGRGDGNFCLFIGRISPEKGLDILLNAWKIIGHKIPLKIIGEGKTDNNIPGVEYLGKMNYEKLLDLLGKATLLIFPSKCYESFGRVIIEAYAKGTPVIAPFLGTMAELVTNGKTGLHYNPNDSEDLSKKILTIYNNKTELSKMRVNARNEYLKYFTAEKVFEKYKNIICDLNKFNNLT